MDAASEVRPAKINPAGRSHIEVSCSFFSFKDVAILSGVGAKNQRGADTTCKNEIFGGWGIFLRLKYDSSINHPQRFVGKYLSLAVMLKLNLFVRTANLGRRNRIRMQIRMIFMDQFNISINNTGLHTN